MTRNSRITARNINAATGKARRVISAKIQSLCVYLLNRAQ